MPLVTIGLNHKTAPLDIRERVIFAPEHMGDALRHLTDHVHAREAAILSTCNRTEVVCCIDADDSDRLVDWFHTYHNLRREEIEPYLYTHPDQNAVRHILRVASGLDSLILGEPQILGQIKDAYVTAKSAGTIGKLLNKLFEHTFAVAKQVRTDTAIGASPVSVAFAAVSLAKQIFSTLTDHTALLIGAGDTIELVARHLNEQGVKHLIVANRTVERAMTLAGQFSNSEAIALPDIPDRLPEADMIISSTASPLPILGKGAVESALKLRKHRPMFMVDIAVPRDIEPEVGDLSDVYLYTVDDLHEVIEEGRQSREEAAEQAQEIIENQVEHYMGWLRSLEAVNTIRNFREQAEHLRDEAIQTARRQLAAGKNPELVVAELGRILTQKLLHQPTVQMNRAAFEGREDLDTMARQLAA